MARPVLEVADIFRDHGPAWRKANAGHVSLGQFKVMSAIESCRTAALGGHIKNHQLSWWFDGEPLKAVLKDSATFGMGLWDH